MLITHMMFCNRLEFLKASFQVVIQPTMLLFFSLNFRPQHHMGSVIVLLLEAEIKVLFEQSHPTDLFNGIDTQTTRIVCRSELSIDSFEAQNNVKWSVGQPDRTFHFLFIFVIVFFWTTWNTSIGGFCGLEVVKYSVGSKVALTHARTHIFSWLSFPRLFLPTLEENAWLWDVFFRNWQQGKSLQTFTNTQSLSHGRLWYVRIPCLDTQFYEAVCVRR